MNNSNKDVVIISTILILLSIIVLVFNYEVLFYVYTVLMMIFLIYISIRIYSENNYIKHIINYCNKILVGLNDDIDVTKLKTIKNDELEELSNKLIDIGRLISESNRTKTTMIQNISHNLKSPLSNILLIVELLKDSEIPENQIYDYYDKIFITSNKMLFDIQRLINLNKLNYLNSIKKVTDQEIDMVEIVNSCLFTFKETLQIKNIKIKTTLYPAQFCGTYEHWEDLVLNLLDNSTKYARSKIEVTLNKTSLTIYNDGDQIDNINDIFDAYVKGKKGGTGLGLSIVKSIASLYGYGVIAKNVRDGVVFKVWKLDD
ncbi:MAG: HAMP domain-containing histidine kinase [Erysipelotrichaceae bacterium]|nr:HAMP domain-containing histidine kinase [Erysipelotrichaceae bacterium]MDY5252551.1 HAMP domain-containing sensor histidine kinase [Erysipelotrichaceae bacterium]